jgi:signal transduction histidine kinase
LIEERASKAAERSLAVEVEAMAVKLERARIARDIHDGLGHSLNSTKIQLERALKTLEENKADGVLDLLKRCHDSAGASLREVRRAARTEHDDQFSLQKSVLELAEQVKQESALTFSVHLDEVSLSQKVQYQLFYIIQECLTNIRKHSGASHVEIRLNLENGQASLCVRDNGKGFDMNVKHSGFGRKGLFERTDSIGATLKVESIVGQGTAVFVRFPVPQK